ncbi:MAG: DUF3109 family protein [Flavobacteriales bacterium]|jgi:hypothetical protein|nr:DUF3109 family protein [Flavobacteriales bacterium]
MIQIKDTLISDDIITECFVCDLSRCKGECCIAGDSGAPVGEEEKKTMEDILPHVLPYMTPEGRRTVELMGAWVVDSYDRSPVTPLIDGKECAYLIKNDEGISLCAIEQAYNDGKIRFKKPISCHLYPIRLSQIMSYTALNYHRWEVCSDACVLGKKLGVPIYKFLKEPLTARFGKNWYAELELTAREYLKMRKK